MKDRESEEMYLETILLLQQKKSVVHSVDVVEELGYAKSSVSRGVNLLAQRGYIVIENNGALVLTDAGRSKANGIYERHRVLTEMLLRMGVDREEAERNACRIEHVISLTAFNAIKEYIEKQVEDSDTGKEE